MKTTHQTLFEALTSLNGAQFIDAIRQRHLGLTGTEPDVERFFATMSPECTVVVNGHERRIDAVVLVHSDVPRRPENLEFSISVEFKDELGDLQADNKYRDYVGTCDYFFFGVPYYLIRAALDKAAGQADVGVVCLDDGRIVKMPEAVDVAEKTRKTIFHRFYKKNHQNH